MAKYGETLSIPLHTANEQFNPIHTQNDLRNPLQPLRAGLKPLQTENDTYEPIQTENDSYDPLHRIRPETMGASYRIHPGGAGVELPALRSSYNLPPAIHRTEGPTFGGVAPSATPQGEGSPNW